jgi:hypothetical protein
VTRWRCCHHDDAQAFISKPHFLDCPDGFALVNMSAPNVSDHESFIDVEPVRLPARVAGQ